MAPRLAALAANCGQLPMKAQEFGVRCIEWVRRWSGRRDSNSRPPDPQSGALARLRYVPIGRLYPEVTIHGRMAIRLS
jgi:hypothetical protein